MAAVEIAPVSPAVARVGKKKPRAPKTSSAPSHPPYFEMIKEALMALKERTGSSPYAIAKFMEEKHQAVLPANYKKMLSIQLKNSAAKGRLVKVKASFKLSDSGKKEAAKEMKPAAKKKSAAVKTPSAAATKKKPEKEKKSAAATAGTKRKATSAAATKKKKAKAASSPAPAKPKSIKKVWLKAR